MSQMKQHNNIKIIKKSSYAAFVNIVIKRKLAQKRQFLFAHIIFINVSPLVSKIK